MSVQTPVRSSRRVSVLRVATRALRATMSRPGLVAVLALALTAARLLVSPPIRLLLEAIEQRLVADTSVIRPLALLLLASGCASALVATSAGAVFGVISTNRPFAALVAELRHAPAFTAALVPVLGLAAAALAEVGTMLAVMLGAGDTSPLVGSALLASVGMLSSMFTLFCSAATLLTLLRIGASHREHPTIASGLAKLGETTLCLLAHPTRALGAMNAALVVTLPLTLLIWFTLPLTWTDGTGRGASYLLMFGQGLCLSASLIAVALTLGQRLKVMFVRYSGQPSELGPATARAD